MINRFYKQVMSENHDGIYRIVLDGRAVKTKSGAFVETPYERAAQILVQEWEAQSDQIDPDTMPFTQILNTKIDRIAHERAQIHASIMKYLDTDLICYYTDRPETLLALQKQKWGKWEEWFNAEFGVALRNTQSLEALKQDADIHQKLDAYIASLDDDHFTMVQLITSISGSIILAVAMVKGGASAEDIFDACFVEEHFKDTIYDVEKYGLDPMQEKKRKLVTLDLTACRSYLDILAA